MQKHPHQTPQHAPHTRPYVRLSLMLCCALITLTACNLLSDVPPPTLVNITLPTLQAPSSPMPSPAVPPPDELILPPGWRDVRLAMEGFCFESMADARDRPFILRDENARQALYDGSDDSGLCLHPAQRPPIEGFDEGRIIIGIWSYSQGCRAWHSLQQTIVDEQARRITLHITHHTEGTCNYQLIRPLWLMTDPARAAYEVELNVSATP